MTRGNQHARHIDDALAAHAPTQPGNTSRSGEWRNPEMPVEDEPGGSTTKSPPQGGAPQGMTPDDVEGRSRLARLLPTGQFPMSDTDIRRHLIDTAAPDTVIAEVMRLPPGEYGNVTQVWKALGHGTEEPRR